MARDFEDINDIEQLDDRELRGVIRDHLAAHNGLDINDITVEVKDGAVTLGGRVGTEGERRIADHILTDVLGINDFANELVIDPIRRAESPIDIDEHLAEEERDDLPDFLRSASVEDRQELGARFVRFTAEHPWAAGLDYSDKDPDEFVKENG